MRVVVLGGYGVFGSLLTALLIRDGHEVWIAGRDAAKAAACAARLGARPLTVDHLRDPSRILEAAPQAVIDAAGPFQDYGADPYRIARFCIENDADYFDLSDDADFTAGIAALDEAARAAGRRVLSGASSVPGLSSSVASELAAGLDEVTLIETAILPGNRAPRGRSVIASILGRVGRPCPVWRGCLWRELRCWSARRVYRLAPGLDRAAYFIGVPDTVLFPAFFSARSVLFRAGMELGILNAALRGLAVLQGKGLLPFIGSLRAPAHWIASRLEGLGSDHGAMVVDVTGPKDGVPVRRRWRLLAEAGEGPFIPGVMIRALLRRIDRIPPGARPCLAEATLEEAEQAMSDLAISTAREETARPSLFQAALSEAWPDLDTPIQRLHAVQDVLSFCGTASVKRGTGVIARLAAWVFGFPLPGENVPVTVTLTRTEHGETWERNFAGRTFRSVCSRAQSPSRYRERFGWFVYELELSVKGGSLCFRVRRGWFLDLPIPQLLLPKSDSREFTAEGLFHFDVALSAPLGLGLIVHYRGSLRPEEDPGGGQWPPTGCNG